MVGDFPFMLSLVEAFLGFSAESISKSRDRSVTALIASMAFITAPTDHYAAQASRSNIGIFINQKDD